MLKCNKLLFDKDMKWKGIKIVVAIQELWVLRRGMTQSLYNFMITLCTYTTQFARGQVMVDQMKMLARAGQGLNSYISRTVRNNFYQKLR